MLLLAVVVVVAVLAAVGLAISRVAVARVQVSSAADLAALAAARSSDCAAAQDVAHANRTVLISCELEGQDVQVGVGLDVDIAGRTLHLNALSRAGPP